MQDMGFKYCGILSGMDIFSTENPVQYEEYAIAGNKLMPCPKHLIFSSLMGLVDSYMDRRLKRIYDFILAPEWYMDLIASHSPDDITRTDGIILIMPYNILPEEQKLKHIQADNDIDILEWVMLNGAKSDARHGNIYRRH